MGPPGAITSGYGATNGGSTAEPRAGPGWGRGPGARRPGLRARGGARGGVGVGGGEGAGPVAGESIDALQRGILNTCVGVVRVGGELLFAVCTLTRAEGEGMRAWFLQAQGGAFEPWACDRVEDESLRAPQVTLRPDRDGTDGFVLWRVRRVR